MHRDVQKSMKGSFSGRLVTLAWWGQSFVCVSFKSGLAGNFFENSDRVTLKILKGVLLGDTKHTFGPKE